MANYTIDLANLSGFAGLEGSGQGQESEVTVAKKVVQEVGSEDEGPTDFTQNLEEWMMGKEVVRRDRSGSMKKARHADVEDLDGDSEFIPLNPSTSLPQNNLGHRLPEDTSKRSQQLKNIPCKEGSGSTLPTQRETDVARDKATEEVLDQISALQAEVIQRRAEVERYLEERDETERAKVRAEEETDKIRQELEVVMASKAHLEHDYKKASEQYEKLKREHNKIDEQDDELTVNLDDSLSRAYPYKTTMLDEQLKVKDMITDTRIAVGKVELAKAQISEFKRLVCNAFEPSTSPESSAGVNTHREAADTKIARLLRLPQPNHPQVLSSELNDEVPTDESVTEYLNDLLIDVLRDLLPLRSVRERFQELLAQLESQVNENQKIAANVANLEDQILHANVKMSHLTSLTSDLETTRAHLSESRRLISDIECENDVLNKTISKQSRSLQEAQLVLSASKESTAKLHEAEALTIALQADLKRIMAENRHKGDSDDQTEQQPIARLMQQHQAELNALRSVCGEDFGELKQMLKGIIKDMHTQDVSGKSGRESEAVQLKEQISALIECHSKALSMFATKETELHEAARSMDKRVRKADEELARVRQELIATRSEVETQKEITRVVREINQEMDEKVANILKEREAVWSRRVQREKEEKEKRGKVLLNEWGKHEVGAGGGAREVGGEGRKQGYRYKFVKK